MAHIAEAIKNQTAELANLVRSQTETTTHPAGSMKGLGKQTEELVFLMRACGQYDVKLCPGEHGQSLAQGLVSAQHGAATKLRNLGCRQKMTQRMAIALAGPYWGTHEKYAIGVADFLSRSPMRSWMPTLGKPVGRRWSRKPDQHLRPVWRSGKRGFDVTSTCGALCMERNGGA